MNACRAKIGVFPQKYLLKNMTGQKTVKGISFLQSIRRKRQKPEELKRRYLEEENARQYLHGMDYGRARVSGGRVSTLDDEIERHEERLAWYAQEIGRAYLSYITDAVTTYEVIDETPAEPRELAFMAEYYLFDADPRDMATRYHYSPSYIRVIIAKGAKAFSRKFEEWDTPGGE